MLISTLVGLETWDDGYITLAFSRTFAETGHIALTPLSQTVEGATSPAWFLIMAGIYKLGATGFSLFHFASQFAAALCAAAAAALFHTLIRPSASTAAWWITLLVFLLGPVRAESVNGMEMLLLCAIALGAMLLVRDGRDARQWQGLAALAAAAPWVRLEATGYLAAGVLAVWAFSRARNERAQANRLVVAVLAASTVSVLVLALARYYVFGTVVLTNTMLAKSMTPYSPEATSPAWWTQQLQSFVVEPLATTLPAIVLFLVLSRVARQGPRATAARFKGLALARDLPQGASFGLGYAIAFLGFTFVFGANTFNTPGRMGLSAMLVLAVVAVNAVPLPAEVPRFPVKTKLGLAALFLVPFIGLFSVDTTGIFMRVEGKVDSGNTFIASHALSAFRTNGEVADSVRELIGLRRASFLLVEVGQPSLCCEKLEILDLGLLANRDLVKSGWGGFPEYLRSHSPDIIQLHSAFTQSSGITEDSYFIENYVPVFAKRSSFSSLLYLRKDHYSRLQGKCSYGAPPQYYFFDEFEPLTSKKGEPADSTQHIDKDYLRSLGASGFCHIAVS